MHFSLSCFLSSNYYFGREFMSHNEIVSRGRSSLFSTCPLSQYDVVAVLVGVAVVVAVTSAVVAVVVAVAVAVAVTVVFRLSSK